MMTQPNTTIDDFFASGNRSITFAVTGQLPNTTASLNVESGLLRIKSSEVANFRVDLGYSNLDSPIDFGVQRKIQILTCSNDSPVGITLLVFDVNIRHAEFSQPILPQEAPRTVVFIIPPLGSDDPANPTITSSIRSLTLIFQTGSSGKSLSIGRIELLPPD